MAKINKILANGNEYDSWATNADFVSLSESVAGQIANVMEAITDNMDDYAALLHAIIGDSEEEEEQEELEEEE